MLMRSDPFRELDRLTEQLWGSGGRLPAMPMDAFKQGDQFVVCIDLPGVDPGSIDLTVEKNVLTVTAERVWHRGEDVEVIAAERPHGRSSRQLFLGEGLDVDRVDASYDSGVLTVHIPVAEQAKPRKVSITAGTGSKPIEATSSAA